MDTKTYRVNGMTCGGCVKHVEKALRAVPGVVAVTVDLAKGTAAVEGTASMEALAARVAEAGYDLVGTV
ncbi:heavy-metal-associated domain-containing protein [Geothrix sp. PMB-07]|uniref:heavy-metal-associated domain-containing protein n=1 Tax=Geothrix sp. PMB-07 TaxID=3068640 RepID=UPI00274083B9|nr:heavy metal-associated domain-containing protein [Geothrix sp. PMB-07]WLT31542.1 heavy metal-associated domain-containing protein [Geothrix sp. PMB-07]